MVHSPSDSYSDDSKSAEPYASEKASLPVLGDETGAQTSAALASPNKNRPEAALGDAVLRFLRIRKGGSRVDQDAVSSSRANLLTAHPLISLRLQPNLVSGTQIKPMSMSNYSYGTTGRISLHSTRLSAGRSETRRRHVVRLIGRSLCVSPVISRLRLTLAIALGLRHVLCPEHRPRQSI
jgi:hypothetical protein